MVMNSTPLSGLIGIVLVVALIGTAAGLALAGTDLLNSNTSAAAARAQDQETWAQAQETSIDLKLHRAEKEAEIAKIASDLETYEAIQAAQAQAEKDKIRLEVVARQRELDQNLAFTRLTRFVILAVATLATLIVSAGLATSLVQWSRSRYRLPLTQAEAAQAAAWHVPAWRAEQIRHARARESAGRKAALGQQAVSKSATGGNGKHPPKGWPLMRPVEKQTAQYSRVPPMPVGLGELQDSDQQSH